MTLIRTYNVQSFLMQIFPFSQIFSRRLTLSMVRSVVAHVMVVTAFLALRSLAPMATAAAITAPSSWFYDVLSSACVAAHCVITARQMRVTPAVAEGPLAPFKAAATAEAAAALAAHAIICSVLLRCHLGLEGGSLNALAVKCVVNGR